MRIATDRWRARVATSLLLATAALSAACVALPVADPPTAAAVASPTRPVAAPAAPASAPPATPAAASTPAPAPAPVVAPSAPPRASGAGAEVVAGAADVATLETAARAFYSYFDRVRQMPPSELAREFVRLDQPQSPTTVLELALALGQTRNPSDTVRALATLDPLVKSTDPQVAPWRPLARLLSARYTEQRRLEEQVERQSQQLREAQRRQEQLAQQLEALKAIERSLVNRPAAPPAGANGGRATTP